MGRKVSDGQAVKVTVPAATTVVDGTFYDLDGFVGMCTDGVTAPAGATAETVLDLSLSEFETSQIETAQAFVKGTTVYWDLTANRFTETAAANRLFGRVTSTKDGSNVVWIKREQ